jgi:hypothetical protein
MTTPPNDVPEPSDPTAEPVSLDKPAEPPFDPYRFGAPEHPVPPEYAPPGYVPPPPTEPPASTQPQYPPYGGQPYGGQPPAGEPYPGQPYPGQPYPYPPPYAMQYPQPKTGNGKATAALVLGIVSIVFCWTSVLDLVPIVLAVIFGILGLTEAKRTGSGRGLAVSGLVCAVVGALFATLVTVWIFNRISPCLENYDQGSTAYNNCIHDRF